LRQPEHGPGGTARAADDGYATLRPARVTAPSLGNLCAVRNGGGPSYGDAGAPPSRDAIDRALGGLQVPLNTGCAPGVSVADGLILIAHRGAHQGLSERCGIWTVDQRLVGYAGPHSSWLGGRVALVGAGQLTDADGRPPLAEHRKRPRDPGRRFRLGGWLDEVVTDGSRRLATIRYDWIGTIIEPAPPSNSWRFQVRQNRCSVSEGGIVLATGHRTRQGGRMWSSEEPTTAIALHPKLDLDQRAVILLVALGCLGPPDPPPDASGD
jgi:hypothetical protein